MSEEQKILNDNDVEMEDEIKKSDDVLSDQVDDKETIKNLTAEISDLKDKLLRNTADHDNTRKRYEKIIDETREYSITNFAQDLMAVMDNLYRAIEHKPQQVNNTEIQNLLVGVELINNELQNTFTKHGIVRILPQLRDKFDYNFHQAVSQIPTNDFEPGMIVNIMQAGYRIKDRLLRPAMVTVAIAKNE